MRIGSLFAGLGGLDLACEWAFNGRTVWQLDQVGAKVRARHWPEALQVTADVADVDPLSLPPIDVLCAGFACQDLSFAGKGASRGDLDVGARTGATYRGVLRFVAALKPEYIVLENVPALLAHRRRLELDLADYGLTWVTCAALDVGAPHRRHRVFVIGHRGAAPGGLIEAPIVGRWRPEDDARGWSTPSAGNFNDGEDPKSFHARRELIKASGKNGNGMGEPLGQQVQVWSTVNARDHRSAGGLAHTKGGDCLNDQAAQVHPWPTVSTRDEKVGSGMNRVGSPPLSEVAAPIGGLGRRLSPAWTETLMGLPIGWTLPEGPQLFAERSPRWPRGRYPDGWDRRIVWPGYSWEPSRTLPDGPPCPGRPAQIRALGNAVVPQQGALAIRTALQPAQVGLFGAA